VPAGDRTCPWIVDRYREGRGNLDGLSSYALPCKRINDGFELNVTATATSTASRGTTTAAGSRQFAMRCRLRHSRRAIRCSDRCGGAPCSGLGRMGKGPSHAVVMRATPAQYQPANSSALVIPGRPVTFGDTTLPHRVACFPDTT
jgi:hypothetical protein